MAAETRRQLALELGISHQQLSREARRPGFPTGQGTAAIRAWRAANIRPRSRAARPAQTLAVAPPAAATASPASGDPAILTLQSGTASALEISEAAVQLASRRVGDKAAIDSLGSNDLDALKKSLQELRQARSGYLELEQQQGNLIEVGQVKAIVGTCCGRLVRALDVLENSIGTEFAMWLADPKVQALPTEERARTIRAYISHVAREVRSQAASDFAALAQTAQESDTDDAGDSPTT